MIIQKKKVLPQSNNENSKYNLNTHNSINTIFTTSVLSTVYYLLSPPWVRPPQDAMNCVNVGSYFLFLLFFFFFFISGEILPGSGGVVSDFTD